MKGVKKVEGGRKGGGRVDAALPNGKRKEHN